MKLLSDVIASSREAVTSFHPFRYRVLLSLIRQININLAFDRFWVNRHSSRTFRETFHNYDEHQFITIVKVCPK